MSTYVTKADGSREAFQESKLRESLRRAGAAEDDITRVVSVVQSELKDGTKTEAIYRRAFEVLDKREDMAATRYSLRRALFGLGPTGFPFEKFLGRLFEHQGYTVQIGLEMRGTCAPHELDLVAFKDDDCFIAEAKFHLRPGTKSDLRVALYCYARFLDLKDRRPTSESCGVRSYKIVTNTKFTHTAVSYAKCVGLDLLSWGYPKKGNLQDLVETAHLYPVTALRSLSEKEKRALLETDFILCHDLIDKERELLSIGLSQETVSKITKESTALCRK